MNDQMVAKQGDGDGLCGLYSVLNVISHLEGAARRPKERQRQIFRHILLAADRLGLLDYHHIAVGFEAYELVQIIKFVSDNFGYPFEARILEKFKPTGESYQKAIRRAIDNKACVIVYHEKTDHWVALLSEDILVNSWPNKEEPQGAIGLSDLKNIDYGVVIQTVGTE